MEAPVSEQKTFVQEARNLETISELKEDPEKNLQEQFECRGKKDTEKGRILEIENRPKAAERIKLKETTKTNQNQVLTMESETNLAKSQKIQLLTEETVETSAARLTASKQAPLEQVAEKSKEAKTPMSRVLKLPVEFVVENRGKSVESEDTSIAANTKQSPVEKSIQGAKETRNPTLIENAVSDALKAVEAPPQPKKTLACSTCSVATQTDLSIPEHIVQTILLHASIPKYCLSLLQNRTAQRALALNTARISVNSRETKKIALPLRNRTLPPSDHMRRKCISPTTHPISQQAMTATDTFIQSSKRAICMRCHSCKHQPVRRDHAEVIMVSQQYIIRI